MKLTEIGPAGNRSLTTYISQLRRVPYLHDVDMMLTVCSSKQSQVLEIIVSVSS